MEIKRSEILKKGMLFLFVSMIGIINVSANQYQNYHGITMTNDEYNTLLNLGFTENEIYYMDLTTFNENKSLSATLVAQDTRYLKTTSLYGMEAETIELTKEEYEQESGLSLLTTVETTYKTMTTSMSTTGSKYRYKVDLSWKNMPVTRSYDIIGIGFNDDVHIDSSIYMNYYHCNSSGNCQTESVYYDVKNTAFGGTKVYKIPSSIASLSSWLYFDVAKDNSNQTLTRLSFCGDYSHATTTVSSSEAANHSITSGGIAIGSAVYNKYDSIPCAQTDWYGTW